MLVSTAIGIVYYFAPDAEQDWVWLTPGSIVATVLWLVASLAFKLYIVNVGSYTETYGAIGGVMVLMLWFYLSGLVILVGAEMNAEIEHASAYGKDPGEKVPGQRQKIGPALKRAWEARRGPGSPKPPSADEIKQAIPNLCRCGVYPRLVRAVQRAGRVARRAERISAAPPPGIDQGDAAAAVTAMRGAHDRAAAARSTRA
jgi:hypothetical protein